MQIRKRPTKQHGLAFDLDYRWQGRRYKPLLGYNLSKEEQDRRSAEMILKIQQGKVAPGSSSSPSVTLRNVVPLYWQTMHIKQRVALRRPKSILDTHLLPRFGDRPLASLTAEDGLRYITERLNEKAAPWTVRREWNVLMRILNLAVDFEKLDKNRLKRVQLPDVEYRTRMATTQELQAIQKIAPPELWRIALVALHTGLREAKILEIGRSWLKLRDDGWWLILPAARTRLKGTPREIPLNEIATRALLETVPHVDDRLFRRWNPASLTVYWGRLCTRAKVQDLHFHDLRHTFTTGLQNLGVPLEVRAALLGHTIRGMGTDALGGVAMTSQYSHGGYGWNQQLREAVTRLEQGFLVYEMVYGLVRTNRRVTVNAAKEQEKKWWSQRDSNPCLSLERAPS
jgi:integrase